MINLTRNDYTQKIILRHLKITEQLLKEVASSLSKSEMKAKIIAMPDLGFPRNVKRILGGFFTGALYSWESNVPFIPVDATINSCGVSVFKISKPIESKEAFFKDIQSAIKRSVLSSYDWNYNSGNHFINYGVVEEDSYISKGYYIVMHSSASEFKEYHNGLYPLKGNWYFDKIKTYEKGNRFLRYISGKTAENFYKTAKLLRDYNKIRQRYFANSIFDKYGIENEILFAPHYGMPDSNSIAIGCNFIEDESIYLLLTAPEQSCFFIKPTKGGDNCIKLNKEYILTPHGLGMEMVNTTEVEYYSSTQILFDKELYTANDKLSFDTKLKIRESFYQDKLEKNDVCRFLSSCPGQIKGELKTIYSYNHRTI